VERISERQKCKKTAGDIVNWGRILGRKKLKKKRVRRIGSREGAKKTSEKKN